MTVILLYGHYLVPIRYLKKEHSITRNSTPYIMRYCIKSLIVWCTCLLYCCILNSGCRKAQVYRDPIYGKVIDGTTLEPVAGAKVHLFIKEDYYTLSDTMETVVTNTNGEFYFNEILSTLNDYEVNAEKENYFTKVSDVLVTNNDPNAFIYLEPQAILKLHILNEPPAYLDEHIWLSISDEAEDDEVFSMFFGHDSTGTDTTLYVNVFSDRYNVISWSGESNLKSGDFTDVTTIYCKAPDTSLLEIVF